MKLPVAIGAACVVLQALALADRSQGEPRNRDLRRFVLGEIYDEHEVEQQFVVRGRGFSSITIHPRPASPSPTGTVTLTVRDVTKAREGPIVHRRSLPLADLARADAFTLTFPPQASQNHRYALQVEVMDGSDGQGFGLLAARGTARRATLLVQGRPQWGNLVFETTVDDATSNFGALAAQLGRAPVPAPRAVLLLVLVAANAALFVVLQAFSRWRPDPAAAGAAPARTATGP